ncbi:MAG: RNA polymerase factor sigma-32 [Rickettsia sp.]|nr:RNA polymerase factor sigma-32 [Rickettsia sp.]
MSSAIYDPNLQGLHNYIRKVNNIPSLTDSEEKLLAKKYCEEKDLRSAHRLVTSHLKLVVKIALGYKKYNSPILDLISEGNIGLMNAVKKYDHRLGYRLSTYAMWWIRAAIQEFLLKSRSLLKIGNKVLHSKLTSVGNKIKDKLGFLNYSNNTDQDISSENQKQEYPLINNISLNNKLFANQDSSNNTEIIDLVPETRDNQETLLIKEEHYSNNKNLMFNAINCLSQREREILYARRLEEKPHTLSMLSEQFSISKERVRQIENNAIAKIKKIALSKK